MHLGGKKKREKPPNLASTVAAGCNRLNVRGYDRVFLSFKIEKRKGKNQSGSDLSQVRRKGGRGGLLSITAEEISSLSHGQSSLGCTDEGEEGETPIQRAERGKKEKGEPVSRERSARKGPLLLKRNSVNPFHVGLRKWGEES